ncbi:MAG: hypothetical protein ACRCVT_12130 [Leadbetterella sp.]
MKNTVQKNRKSVFLVALMAVCFIAQTQAQDDLKPKRWHYDASLVGAGVFSLFQGKMTYTLNPNKKKQTELGLGILIQPESTNKANEGFNNDGVYSAKMATVACRQFLYKGIHLEVDINFGQGAVSKSTVDGKDYKSFVVFTQAFIGYKYDFLKREKFNLFLIAQGGIGHAYNANHWPSSGSPEFYGLGDLKMGISF